MLRVPGTYLSLAGQAEDLSDVIKAFEPTSQVTPRDLWQSAICGVRNSARIGENNLPKVTFNSDL